MKKKKLLFIMNSLHCGGAENSLVSLLQLIDYSTYEVDLLLFKKEGFFLKNVPQEVIVLPPINEFQLLEGSFVKLFFKALLQFRFDIILTRLKFKSLKSEKNPAVREQKYWKYLSICLPKLEGEYDVAIGFLEKTPNYYCVEKVTATKKIGFIRTDYVAMKMDATIDKPFFQKLDYILTNSDNATQTMQEVFPEFQDKIKTLENFFAPQTLFALAEEEIEIPKTDLLLVSIGRLTEVKGFDLAIDACKIIKEKVPNVIWLVLGEGSLRNTLQQQIDKNNLRDNFLLLGEKDNPYPYLKAADIYIHTSHFEGKSRAIEEAKIFNKAIVTTNFPSVKNQITDNITGLIVDFKPTEIATAILNLVENDTVKNQLTNNLALKKIGIEDEIEKIYKLII